MKICLVLSAISIVLLCAAFFLGLMVYAGKMAPSIHMMVAFFAAFISIACHVMVIGRYFKKNA